jgi:hypothetical protein
MAGVDGEARRELWGLRAHIEGTRVRLDPGVEAEDDSENESEKQYLPLTR